MKSKSPFPRKKLSPLKHGGTLLKKMDVLHLLHNHNYFDEHGNEVGNINEPDSGDDAGQVTNPDSAGYVPPGGEDTVVIPDELLSEEEGGTHGTDTEGDGGTTTPSDGQGGSGNPTFDVMFNMIGQEVNQDNDNASGNYIYANYDDNGNIVDVTPVVRIDGEELTWNPTSATGTASVRASGS